MAPKLSPKQARFCEEILVDENATAAAIRAGYSARGARKSSSETARLPHVKAHLAKLRAERAKRTSITADAVLRRFWLIATADPNELVSFRRTCCRHCYGRDHEYQHTRIELRRKRAAWESTQKKNSPETFDDLGGDGFDARKAPHPDCPECFGEGLGDVFLPDTRRLSEGARLLYAGVKQTKDGLEVKTHDQMAALVNIGKHLGMFGDRVEEPEDAETKALRIRSALAAMDDATLGAAA